MRADGVITSADDRPRRRPRRSTALLHRLVLDAAVAEFEAHGFGGATTAAIARRAGVTEAQLFRQFASKQALFRAAIFEPLSRQFADFMQRHPAPVAAADRDGLAAAYTGELQQFVATHRRMLVSLVVAEAHGRGEGATLGGIEELGGYFDRGAALMAQRRGDGTGGPDPRLVVRIAFAAVLGTALLQDWLFPPDLAATAAIREAVTDFVVRGASGMP